MATRGLRVSVLINHAGTAAANGDHVDVVVAARSAWGIVLRPNDTSTGARETATALAEDTGERAEAERAGADAFLLRRAQHASLPVVPAFLPLPCRRFQPRPMFLRW